MSSISIPTHQKGDLIYIWVAPKRHRWWQFWKGKGRIVIPGGNMSKWTDPSATVVDDNHEVRELRWRIKELNKICGRQGETIHRLRGELADVRQLNSKVERGQVRNLERMLAWYQRDIEHLRAKIAEQRVAATEPMKEAASNG